MRENSSFRLYLIKTKTERGKFRRMRTVDLHCEQMQRLTLNAPTLTIAQIERYLLSLLEKGCKGTYINDYIDTLHLYGRFLQTDLYESLIYYPEEEFIQATMSIDEINAFLALPCPMITRYDPRQKKTISYAFNEKGYNRWTLFFKILFYTGMRCGEVAHLTIEKIDIGRGVIVLPAVDVKTNTFRHVPISPALLHDVTAYIKELSGELLFPAQSGKSKRQGDVVDDVDWGYNFHQRLKRLGIKRKNLRPSSIRPSFITRMLGEDNVNVFQVQKIVGHKNISTTQHYTHLTTKQIIKTIKQDPLGRAHLTRTERLLQGRRALEDLGFIVPVAQEIAGKIYYEVLDN